MQRVVALLAAALTAAGLAACGGDGAEPGALRGATLVLDFQPNAVHSGIYAAMREGYYRAAGVDLRVQAPSASTDAPKLLEARRTQFAILDIHDLAIAGERGLDVVGVEPIVNRPLAAVIAADRRSVTRPRDLAGRTVGVTGLPSDAAVLGSVLDADGVTPSQVRSVTIGFQAVSALASGKVDAATAFWNAEGVTLQREGIPIREFRVDRFGAPRYPELLLCTTSDLVRRDPALVREMVSATQRGYKLATASPRRALDALVSSNPGLDRADQAAELHALLEAGALKPADSFRALGAWARWDAGHGIVETEPRPGALFTGEFLSSSSSQ
jgi:NitT/TauT family transport system substrate-binding protein/putative hydroxymethylpyrimidine transport system substrate-binding protein